jgi:4-amino-4-deoxy-L-arabinose transferase-like glycosyltransferase
LLLYWGIGFLYFLAKVLFKEETFKGSLKKFLPILGTGILASLPVLGWYYYAYSHYGELFVKVFHSEVIHRALNPNKGWNFTFYFVVILWAFIPLSLHFYYSLVGILLRLREHKRLLFPFVWFAGVIGAFTLAKGKIPVYILPAFPAMALLVARLDRKEHPAIAGLNYLNFLILLPLTGFVLFFFNFLSVNSFLAVSLLSLAFFFLLNKYDIVRNIILIVPLYHFLIFSILPWVENYRPYKEVITELKTSYGDKELVTLGFFYKDFPFYWGKKVYRVNSLGELKKFKPERVLLFSDKPLKGWKIVKRMELYTGSESRFVKFLRDIKEHKRFKTFYFMVKD